MVDGVDDAGVGGEEGVSLDLSKGQGYGLLAKGAADLFQGVEVGGVRGFLDEVDIGEATLFEGEWSLAW